MQTPFFSIIIPCYNSQDYIIETLDSIKNQSFKNFEVILVDDLSSDNSYNISVDYFNNNNLSGICVKKDLSIYPKGVSGARNQGIDLAKGEWICFLDSDDLYHPERLNFAFKSIEKYNNCFALYHKPHDFMDGSSIVFENYLFEKVEIRSSNILNEMLNLNLIYTSTVSIKKEIFNKYKFNYLLNGIEDYYLWLQICKNSEWIYLNCPLTEYRVRKSSLMGGRKMNYYINQNYLLIKELRSNHMFVSNEIKKVENYLMVNIMKYYASISINNYGWLDFSKGVIDLFVKGYYISSIKLFLKHFKFAVLKFFKP